MNKLQNRLQDVERENQELRKREKEVLPVKKQRSRSHNPGFTYKPKVEKPTSSFTSVTTKPTEKKKGPISPPPPPSTAAAADETKSTDIEEKKNFAHPIISTRSPAFLKVIFNREEDVKKVLNSKRCLQKFPSFRNVFINESKPKHEREIEREERRRYRDEHFEHFSPRDIRHPNSFYSHHHPPRRRRPPPRYYRWWMGPPTESHWEY